MEEEGERKKLALRYTVWVTQYPNIRIHRTSYTLLEILFAIIGVVTAMCLVG